MTEQKLEGGHGRRPWPKEVARVAEVLGLAALTVGATLPAFGCRGGVDDTAARRLSEDDLAEASTAMHTYRSLVDTLTVRGILTPEQARDYAHIRVEELVQLSPGAGLILNMENDKVDEIYALKNASDLGWRELFAQKGIVASAEDALAQLADSSTPLQTRIGLARRWANAAAAHGTP